MNQSNPSLSTSRDEDHMLGHGFYNKHSHEQGKANTYGLPLIIDAINHIDLRQIGDEFPIADYGSAQGQNSLLPMKTAIAQSKHLWPNPAEQQFLSRLHTPTCRQTIGRHSSRRSSFRQTVIWPASLTYFVSPAVAPSTSKFFRRSISH
jgi:hypothetical protein